MRIVKIQNFISMIKKSNIFLMLFVLILAFSMRIIYLSVYKVIDSDGVIYARLAESLMSGHGFIDLDGGRSIILRPLYPLLIGFANLFFKNLEFSGRIVSILFGSLVPIIVFLIGKNIFSRKEGFLAALLVSVSPILAPASAGVMTETLYMFLICSGILCLYYALTKRKKSIFLLSGFVFGLTYLTRPEGIGYILVGLGAILFFNFKQLNFGKRLNLVIFFVFGALISILPLLIYIRVSFGSCLISPEIYHLRPINLSVYLRNLYYSAYIVQIPAIFTPVLMVLFGVGLLRSIFKDDKIKKNIYLLSFIFYPLMIYPWNTETTISWRHYTIILPILYIWVARGITEPARWLSESAKKYVKVSVTIFLIVLVFADFTPRLLSSFRKKDPYLECPIEYKITGEWIKNNLGKDKVIISRVREIAFYGGCNRIEFPKKPNDLNELVYFAKTNKVDYLVVDRRWTARLFPYLYALFDGNYIPVDLRLVYVWNVRPEYEVRVYKIVY